MLIIGSVTDSIIARVCYNIILYNIIHKSAMLAEDVNRQHKGRPDYMFNLYTCIKKNWNKKNKKLTGYLRRADMILSLKYRSKIW